METEKSVDAVWIRSRDDAESWLDASRLFVFPEDQAALEVFQNTTRSDLLDLCIIGSSLPPESPLKIAQLASLFPHLRTLHVEGMSTSELAGAEFLALEELSFFQCLTKDLGALRARSLKKLGVVEMQDNLDVHLALGPILRGVVAPGLEDLWLDLSAPKETLRELARHAWNIPLQLLQLPLEASDLSDPEVRTLFEHLHEPLTQLRQVVCPAFKAFEPR